MKIRSLYLSLSLTLAIAGLYSCTKKANNINNGQVIATPYALFFADTAGAVYSTNDGKTLSTIFPADGKPARALVTSGSNLLVIKNNAYYNVNNSINFNLSYNFIASYPQIAVNSSVIDMDQTMAIDIPSWTNLYVASSDPSGFDFFGIERSDQHGIVNSWYPEAYYDTDNISSIPAHVNSFTMLKNGTLIGHDISNVIFYTTSSGTRWKQTKPVVSALPSGGYFSIGHINDELIAMDVKGGLGVFYSDDLGAHWNVCSGVPLGRPLRSINSPFEQVCMIGTDSAGIYLLNPATHTFQASNTGLGANTNVRGITFKENIFKNDTKQQYVYIATNKGIYQSSDMGKSWVKTITGNYVAIY